MVRRYGCPMMGKGRVGEDCPQERRAAAMKRWTGIALLMLALGGCGGGGDREPFAPLEEPAFDLTGRWVTTAMDCSSFSSDLPEPVLAELDAQLEDETLQSPGGRVVQMGNDLAFTDLETGRRWDGTISGDQVRYADSDRREMGGLGFDAYLEAEGTVLDAGRIAGTYDLDWTFRVEGETVTGGTLCTVRLQRAGGGDPDSTVPGADRQPPFTGAVVVNDAGRAIDDWGDDPYELGTGGDAPSLAGDILTLTVSYSGGCARHDFTLVADSRFQESDPVLLNVHVVHDGHDDPCEAYPTERRVFDLTPLKRLYRDAYGVDEGVVVVRLMGPAPSARFPDMGYAFAVTYAFE